MSYRLVLADDHALVRAGLRALVEALPGMVVEAECSDGAEALHQVRNRQPDVLLLDLAMPGLSGFAVLEALQGEAHATRCLVLSMHDSPEYLARAMALGASGYVIKNAAPETLAAALQAVAGGQTWFPPDLAHPRLTTPEHPPLSDRQREVLRLIAEGLSTRDIAAALSLSVKTVETHRTHLMEKLALNDVPSLTRYAIKIGLIEL